MPGGWRGRLRADNAPRPPHAHDPLRQPLRDARRPARRAARRRAAAGLRADQVIVPSAARAAAPDARARASATASAPTCSSATSRAGCGNGSRASCPACRPSRRSSPACSSGASSPRSTTTRPGPPAHPRLRDYLARADAVMRYELAHAARRPVRPVHHLPPGMAGRMVARPASASVAPDATPRPAPTRPGRPSCGGGCQRRPARRIRLRRLHRGRSQSRGAALVAAGTLPAELHVFCLPTMPPLHLGAAAGARPAASTCSVYALNPCREYWFEVVDRRRLAYLAPREAGPALHHEEGHRLLAAWGQQTQAQLELLVDACGDAAVDEARFDETPAGTTLLARLQRSILDLRRPGAGSIAARRRRPQHRSPRLPLAGARARGAARPAARPLRRRPDPPAPADILVVTPDLDAAAPLIDAIFGTAPPERRIPYHVTGRARSASTPAARALLELLALAGSRFAASAVFGLLQQPLVARRFGLDTDALDARARLAAGRRRALGARRRAPRQPRPAGAGAAQLRRRPGAPLPRLRAAGARRRAVRRHACRPATPKGSDAVALGALWRFIDALAALRRDVSQRRCPRRRGRRCWPRCWSDFVAPRRRRARGPARSAGGAAGARPTHGSAAAATHAAAARRGARRGRAGARRPGARRRADRRASPSRR